MGASRALDHLPSFFDRAEPEARRATLDLDLTRPAKRSRTVAGWTRRNGDGGGDALDLVQDGLLALEWTVR